MSMLFNKTLRIMKEILKTLKVLIPVTILRLYTFLYVFAALS